MKGGEAGRAAKAWRITGYVLFLVLAAVTAGCSDKADQQAATSGPRVQSATERAKTDTAFRQQAIDFQSEQLKHANLPPEQKQRLLEQLHATGPH